MYNKKLWPLLIQFGSNIWLQFSFFGSNIFHLAKVVAKEKKSRGGPAIIYMYYYKLLYFQIRKLHLLYRLSFDHLKRSVYLLLFFYQKFGSKAISILTNGVEPDPR